MKAFNLKTNGVLEFTTDTEQYATDVKVIQHPE